MSKPNRRSSPHGSESSTENQTDELQHLRDLLVGPTEDSLEELRTEFAKSGGLDAQRLGKVLPEAITHSTASGSGLAKSMGPTISAAFEESVRRDPQKLADAVSPIMGPAIQRYIQQQIQAMVQSLNTAIDHSLSPKSLRWRYEAWQTGKPFAEVVLLHTLVYRIEQVLLIDPNSGTLMHSVSSHLSSHLSSHQGGDNADLVSSLLTAIQDFTRESFTHRTEAGSDLQEIQTNELKVWIQHGSMADLAIAIRGVPPRALRRRLQTLLDRIHVEHGSRLRDFVGDDATLELIRPDLEQLLESEFVNDPTVEEDSPSKSLPLVEWCKRQLRWILPTALLVALIAGGWTYQRQRYLRFLTNELEVPATAKLSLEEDIVRIEGSARQAWIDGVQNRFERFEDRHQLDLRVEPNDRAWCEYLKYLRVEPGITVIEAKRIAKDYFVTGYRDPDSVDPMILLSLTDLPESRVQQHWDLIRSSDPRLILRRLKANIEFPPQGSVDAYYDLNADKVFVHGIASPAWGKELQDVIRKCQFDEGALDLQLLEIREEMSN